MPDRLFADTLAHAADAYRARLASRVTEINLLWELVRTGDESPLLDLQRYTHRLKGSAKMYGYDRLGEVAGALDDAFTSLQDEGNALDEAQADHITDLVADLTDAAQEDPTSVAMPPGDAGDSDAGARNQTVVLIADDDVHVRDLLTLYLERDGIRVLTAANGAEALDRVRTHTPDVLVLDLDMPDMDGLEALRRLRDDATTESLPVIVLTADGELDTALRVMSHDVAGYLNKPAEAHDIVGKVFDTLQRAA